MAANPVVSLTDNPLYVATHVQNGAGRGIIANQTYGASAAAATKTSTTMAIPTAAADSKNAIGGHDALLNATYSGVPVGAAPVDLGAAIFAIPMAGESGFAFVGNNTPGAAPSGRGYVNQNMVAQVMAEAAIDVGGHDALLNATYSGVPVGAAPVDLGAAIFAIPLAGESGLAFVGDKPGAAPSGSLGYVNQNMVAQVMAEEEAKKNSAMMLRTSNNIYDVGVPTRTTPKPPPPSSQAAAKLTVVEDTAIVGARYLPIDPDGGSGGTVGSAGVDVAGGVQRTPHPMYVDSGAYASILGETDT
eukprot:gene8260-17745_t